MANESLIFQIFFREKFGDAKIDEILGARTCSTLLRKMSVLGGYATYEEQLMKRINPMTAYRANKDIPLLTMNALDDPICTTDNIDDHARDFENFFKEKECNIFAKISPLRLDFTISQFFERTAFGFHLINMHK